MHIAGRTCKWTAKCHKLVCICAGREKTTPHEKCIVIVIHIDRAINFVRRKVSVCMRSLSFGAHENSSQRSLALMLAHTARYGHNRERNMHTPARDRSTFAVVPPFPCTNTRPFAMLWRTGEWQRFSYSARRGARKHSPEHIVCSRAVKSTHRARIQTGDSSSNALCDVFDSLRCKTNACPVYMYVKQINCIILNANFIDTFIVFKYSGMRSTRFGLIRFSHRRKKNPYCLMVRAQLHPTFQECYFHLNLNQIGICSFSLQFPCACYVCVCVCGATQLVVSGTQLHIECRMNKIKFVNQHISI